MNTRPPFRPLLRALRPATVERPLDRPTVTTDRLTLRPHRLEDWEAWYAIQSEPAINRFMNWPARDPEASYQHLRARIRHTGLRRVDDFLALAIDLDGLLIGDVSLRLKCVTPRSRNVEISWLLHPEYEGYGYATEAATAGLDLAFRQLEARWAVAMIDARNSKSIALAERLQFRPVPLDESTVAYFASATVVANAPVPALSQP